MFRNKRYLAALVGLAIAVMVGTVALATSTPGTAISNLLGDGFEVLSLESEPVTLSWVTGPPESLWIGQDFVVEVQATSLATANGGQDFTNALFIIEVTVAGNPATPADITVVDGNLVALGYDAAAGFFYYGPPTGFPLLADYSVATTFKVTPITVGAYIFTIQCVDLTTP